MTQNEFFEELAKTKDLYEWYFEDDLSIRASYKECKEGNFCPITAVYFHKTGGYKRPSSYDLASKELGFDNSIASLIATAADAPIINLNEIETEFRRKLLTTLDLKENDNG